MSSYLYLIIQDIDPSINRYFVQPIISCQSFSWTNQIKKSVNSCLDYPIIYYRNRNEICLWYNTPFFLSFSFLDTAFIPYGTRLYIAYVRQNHLLSWAESPYSQQKKRSIEFVKTNTYTIVMLSPTHVIISSECYAHRERKERE